MERECGPVEFFRVRSSGRVAGARDLFAVSTYCSQIDFTRRQLLHEAAIIGVITKGAFSYEVVRDLPWDDYEELVSEVPKTIEAAYKKGQEE